MSARRPRVDDRLRIDSRSETGGNVLLRLEKETERQPERSESDEDDNSEGAVRGKGSSIRVALHHSDSEQGVPLTFRAPIPGYLQ